MYVIVHRSLLLLLLIVLCCIGVVVVVMIVLCYGCVVMVVVTFVDGRVRQSKDAVGKSLHQRQPHAHQRCPSSQTLTDTIHG